MLDWDWDFDQEYSVLWAFPTSIYFTSKCVLHIIDAFICLFIYVQIDITLKLFGGT